MTNANQTFFQSANHPELKVASQAFVQLGNKGDCGQYRGDVVLCNVHQMRENEFTTGFLVEPVDNPGFLADAVYAPRLYNMGDTESVLYSTNARVIGNGVGGVWTRERCIQSLGYSI